MSEVRSISPWQENINEFSEAVMESSCWAACGYAVSASAAAHWMLSYLIGQVATPIFHALFCGRGASGAALIVGYTLKICTVAALSAAVVGCVGLPLHFTTAFILTAVQDVLLYLFARTGPQEGPALVEI